MNLLSKSKVSIEETDHVLRRVDDRTIHDDGRISSRLFFDRKAQPSVHLERLAILSEIKREHPETLFWVRIHVGRIQRENLGVVVYNPTSLDDSHCLILNLQIETTSLSKSQVNKKKHEQSYGLLRIVAEKVELLKEGKVVSPLYIRPVAS